MAHLEQLENLSPPRKRGRRWKWTRRLTLAALIACAAAWGFVEHLVPVLLRRQAIAALGAKGRARVEIGSVVYIFPFGAEAQDVKVWAPGDDGAAPVLAFRSASAVLDGFPWPGSKILLSRVRLDGLSILVTERPEGRSTLADWLRAMQDARPDESSKRTSLHDVLEIDRLELRDGLVGWIPLGADQPVALDRIKLDLDSEAAGDGRFYDLDLDAELNALGPVRLHGRVDVDEWRIELSRPFVDLQLDPQRSRQLPDVLRRFAGDLHAHGRLRLDRGRAEILLRDLRRSNYSFVARIEKGRLSPAGTDLRLDDAEVELSADSEGGWRLAAGGRMQDEPGELLLSFDPLGRRPWSMSLNVADGADLVASGGLDIDTGLLRVENFLGGFDPARHPLSPILVRPDVRARATDVSGRLVVSGRAAVDLTVGHIRSAEIDLTGKDVGAAGKIKKKK